LFLFTVGFWQVSDHGIRIRKFPEKIMKMEDLIAKGTITQEAADYLRVLVETGHNIFVSGGTSKVSGSEALDMLQALNSGHPVFQSC